MSADTLVFDMASASEGAPSVFVRKDWLSILDNQNRNYQGNQCIIDTSQLANSNKYMSYREAFLYCPLLLSMTSTTAIPQAGAAPAYAMSLRNWFGSIIHSFSLDYNGTTIVQQTPFIGMWNCFKLQTSLSYGDIITQGASIGFYPDNSQSVGIIAADTGSLYGKGVFNNNAGVSPVITVSAAQATSIVAEAATDLNPVYLAGNSTPTTGAAVGDLTNLGYVKRAQYWNFNPAAASGGGVGDIYSTMISANNVSQLYKSYCFTSGPNATQYIIAGQIYLKHLHNFFERVPLLKGVFMKLILNLNQTSVSVVTTVAAGVVTGMTLASMNSPLGGVSPIMFASVNSGNKYISGAGASTITASIAVGGTLLNSSQAAAGAVSTSALGGSIQLCIPAYTFNPVFETSMLSSPVKKVVYEDIYQYTINNVNSGSPFTYLITNGIANVKSVLVLPYYAGSQVLGTNASALTCPPFQSPFEPAGACATSPLCLFTNFNVQVSGQNAIYNVQRYSWEQFSQQLYGQNAVNGGMTDGLTSSLMNKLDFETEFCYYYVNVARMLPIEEAVPKSINLIGTNMSAKVLDLYVFISYGVEVSIDILSGARV